MSAAVSSAGSTPDTTPDWHMHRDAERYLDRLLRYAHELDRLPLAGDVAVFRFGRTFSHGAIVTEWPVVIHAYWAVGAGRVGDVTRYPLAGREVRFFGMT